MDSPGGPLSFKQATGFGRTASVNVSQLDKIDAIPSRTSNENVLTDGLSPEDQNYLNSLLENSDSSDESEQDSQMRRSAWSPMTQNPVILNRRTKLLKTRYAVTLSLEDISYIRPSWGLSKGIRRIELNDKRKRKRTTSSATTSDHEVKSVDIKQEVLATERLTYYLILLVIAVIVLMLPPYLVEKHRDLSLFQTNRVKLDPDLRVLEFYRPSGELDRRIFAINYGLNIPFDLRAEKCDCSLFDELLNDGEQFGASKSRHQCVACFDWAYRANLRVYVERAKENPSPQEGDICYHIKWQNYNPNFGPIVDCFMPETDDSWYGIGDIHRPNWPWNQQQFEWRPIKSNLSQDIRFDVNSAAEATESLDILGSFVNFMLVSERRLFVGNMKTDFEILANLSIESATGAKRMCLSASCTDKCTETWQRDDHLDQLRLKNNFFEYTVCSGSSVRQLISRHLNKSSSQLARQVSARAQAKFPALVASNKPNSSDIPTVPIVSTVSKLFVNNSSLRNDTLVFADGIGLIERVVFLTSIEYLPVLTGQTIREYVDKIVNLDLKTSLILSIDTRWQTYIGSMKLNSAFFPKAKILLEILHNKGFKIVFTIKPYLDTVIGLSPISDLLEADQLYPTNFVDHRLLRRSESRIAELNALNMNHRQTLWRRESFFTRLNQTIRVRSKDSERFPLLFSCKESVLGYCGLVDLTQPKTRADMIVSIKRIDLLAYGADAIRIGGSHPNSFAWQDHYRDSLSEMVRDLYFKEKLYVIPQFTGDFGYIELAPRSFAWASLRSVLNSVMNLSIMGFALVNPGSVWGDLSSPNERYTKISISQLTAANNQSNVDPLFAHDPSVEKSDEELATRWLQLAVFMPILQFNNLAPINRFELNNLMKNLIKIRKSVIVPELKLNLPYTPMISYSRQQLNTTVSREMAPLIRPVYLSQEDRDIIIAEQFMIGPDILVAPILSDGQRQRDIYLPSGFWRDELRQTGLRGGKWLRNYRVELDEVAWFSRNKR